MIDSLQEHQGEGRGGLLPGTNIENLVDYAEELDQDETLIPAFLALLEMSFQGEKHTLQELQIGIR